MRKEQTLASHSLTKATCIDGQTIIFRLTGTGTIEEPQLEYTLFSEQPINEAMQSATSERISSFLSLTDDLRPFYALAREDTDFAPIVDQLYGYHQVKFLTPFETACWAILTQRNTMAIASKMKRALVERFGSSLELEGTEYWAFPEPVQLAMVNEGELSALIRNGRRGEYLGAVANAFSEVDEQFLKDAPTEEVTAWLHGIKGLGQWSVEFILVRGLGRMEYVPLTEKRLVEAVSRVYSHGEYLSREEIQRIANHYGLWQGYWAHYLRVTS
jgi:DNA-3-methyladenine glycosylase II